MLLVRTYLAPSKIAGIGCFARQFIAEGKPVWRFVPNFDLVLPVSFAHKMYDPDFLDTYSQLDPETGCLVLCSDNARFMNHSDDPNVAAVAPAWDPRQTHHALRDIAEGEELTCDYRIGDADPFCRFKPEVEADRAPSCR